MKKVLFTLIATIAFCSNYAQEKVKPEVSRNIPVMSLGAGRTSVNTAFRYNGELCVLSTNINVKVSMFYFFTKMEPYSCGIVLYRTNLVKKGKSKAELIKLPTDKYFYNYVGSWFKGNTLNIYYLCKNKNKRKNYIFCTRYNLDTKKSEHFKVFETALRNDLTFQISDGNEYLLMAGTDVKSHDKAHFDYLIADHNLKPLDAGYQVALDDKDPLRIQGFTISSKGIFVVKGVTRQPRKSLFKERTYGHPIFIVKNEKARVIEFEADSKYISDPVVFFNKKGELLACYLYGEKRLAEGVSLMEIDIEQAKVKHSTVYGLNGSDKPTEMKKTKGTKVITSIQTTEDGNTMVLAEDYNVYSRTVTSSSKTGTTSRTTTYFDYGPGRIYTFNSEFENTSTCRLNYLAHYANQDAGYGLSFIALPNNIAYLFSENAFYKYRLGNTTYSGKTALTIKGGFRALFGHYSSFSREDKLAYIFDIKNRKSINVQEYTLIP